MFTAWKLSLLAQSTSQMMEKINTRTASVLLLAFLVFKQELNRENTVGALVFISSSKDSFTKPKSRREILYFSALLVIDICLNKSLQPQFSATGQYIEL
jgi:hypothetical protein